MKHRMGYMIYGAANPAMAGGKKRVILKKSMLSNKSIMPIAVAATTIPSPLVNSERLYNLYPNLKYNPLFLLVPLISSFVLSLISSILFDKAITKGVIKYIYAKIPYIKLKAKESLPLESHIPITHKVTTGINADRTILTLLRLQNLFLGVVVWSTLGALYKVLRCFFILCISNIISPTKSKYFYTLDNTINMRQIQ